MIYRAVLKHGPPLTSPDGEPTRGTFYFCKMLFALVQEHKPAYLALAVDTPRKDTFRRRLYPGYKASRDRGEGLSEEVLLQIRRIEQIVNALGVPVIKVESFEADDVIASLVNICASEEVECVVCSSDKDLHQVVGKNCRIYDAMKSEWVSSRDVRSRWGVPPEKIVEVQTLAGDSTDDVPGVSGIGLKTATTFIQKYGSVAGVMEARSELTTSKREALEAADLNLCRQLVALRRDVKLAVSSDALAFNGFNMKKARPIFQKLGFRQWM